MLKIFQLENKIDINYNSISDLKSQQPDKKNELHARCLTECKKMQGILQGVFLYVNSAWIKLFKLNFRIYYLKKESHERWNSWVLELLLTL